MNPLTNAGDLAGLILLAAAIVTTAALTAGQALARYAARLVEDRIASPAALQLEEAVGAGDQEYAIPQPRGVLAARDR